MKILKAPGVFHNYRPRPTNKGWRIRSDWCKNRNFAERISLHQLENGDVFRLLNKHGKPHGPRYIVTRQHQERDWNDRGKYFVYTHNVEFEILNKRGTIWQVGHLNPIVKPIGGWPSFLHQRFQFDWCPI
jgi:hypothetical protein